MVDNVLEFQMNSSVNDISLIHSSTVYGTLISSLVSTVMGGAHGEQFPTHISQTCKEGRIENVRSKFPCSQVFKSAFVDYGEIYEMFMNFISLQVSLMNYHEKER